MAREYAALKVSIWRDAEFRSLAIVEQWAYVMLASHPKLSFCGVLDYLPQQLSCLAAGASPEEIKRLVSVLEDHRFVVVDPTTSELLVRSYVRHDRLLDSPNVTKAMLAARDLVDSETIRDVIDEELARAYEEDPSRSGFGPNGIEKVDPKLWARISGEV